MNEKYMIIALLVPIVLLGAIGVALTVNTGHGEDASISGQLNRAMDKQGAVGVKNDSDYTITYDLNIWKGSSSYYTMYKAHINDESIVIETYVLASGTVPPKSASGRLAQVDYYPVAKVMWISYGDNGTAYKWHR